MILVDVDLSLGRQEVERGQFQVVERFNRPAVLPVGSDELPNRFASVLVATKQTVDVRGVGGLSRAALTGRRSDAFAAPLRLRQRGPACRANRRILRAEKFLGLDRPGHQFTIEAGPVAAELRPETAGTPPDQGAPLPGPLLPYVSKRISYGLLKRTSPTKENFLAR